ncbi:MAG: hemolysin family protein [Rhizobiaceae bacterium]|nr:hemolysin family protein [Rhizobiaceae bacterium]
MTDLLIAFFLILLNGVFALSELAVVSSRKARLRMMVEDGRSGARAALALAEEPGRFLSTVQIGITLVGVLAGAFSGAALGGRLTAFFTGIGIDDDLASPLGFGLVIGAITFLSVIIGELVPKHIALRNPEGIACAVAPGMRLLSRAAAPVVWLLDSTTALLLRLFGIRAGDEPAVTDEEIRSIVAEAENAGVIETAEQEMIAGVMRLGDRTVRAVMTPRADIDMIDASWDEAELRGHFAAMGYSAAPVHSGDPDDVLGIVLAADALRMVLNSRKLDLRSVIREAPVIPDTVDALGALETLQKSALPIALVVDEFGHFEGMVTRADILDAIAGEFHADADEGEPEAVQRADGSWLIAGWMPADEMAERLRIKLPERRAYDTAAGFLLNLFERVPATGDVVEDGGWRYEIVDMDGRRIDKILASRIPE